MSACRTGFYWQIGYTIRIDNKIPTLWPLPYPRCAAHRHAAAPTDSMRRMTDARVLATTQSIGDGQQKSMPYFANAQHTACASNHNS